MVKVRNGIRFDFKGENDSEGKEFEVKLIKNYIFYEKLKNLDTNLISKPHLYQWIYKIWLIF